MVLSMFGSSGLAMTPDADLVASSLEDGVTGLREYAYNPYSVFVLLISVEAMR